MNDICFDPSGTQPPSEPKAVATSFECNDHACDPAAGFDGFITPTMQPLE
jgi:hypothetical protein